LEINEELKIEALESADKFNLKLISINFIKENKQLSLQVVLDKKGGISLNDITDFTQDFNLYLDKETNINVPYQLDCCSPGAEREITLNELPEHINEYMEITYDNKKCEGDFINMSDESIILKYFLKGRPKKVEIPIEKITKIQLKIKI